MKPYTGNAADPRQVEEAKKRVKSAENQLRNDLCKILSLPEGRRYLWAIMSDCKVFGSVWHASALIHYNAGMQDVGHRILADITGAQPNALLQMMQEAKDREAKDGN